MCRNNWNNHRPYLQSCTVTAVGYLGSPSGFPSRLRFDRGLVLLILSRFPKKFWLHELHAGVQRIADRISWLFEAKKTRNTAVNRPRFLWFHREKSPSKLYRSTVCWLGIGGSKPQGFHQNVAKGAWCWVSRLKPTNTSPTSTQHLPNWINTGLMWATRSLFRLAPNTMALMEFLARKHGPKTSPTSPIIGAASPSWTMGSTTLLAQRKLSILLSMSSVGFTGGEPCTWRCKFWRAGVGLI